MFEFSLLCSISTNRLARRCPRCNGYCCRKWIRRHEFKLWMKLIAFYKALGKGMNLLILPQLWVNSNADWVLQPWLGSQSRRKETLNSNLLNLAKKLTPVSHPARAEELLIHTNRLADF